MDPRFEALDDVEAVCLEPATAIAARLASGSISSLDLTRAYLARADRLDPIVHAFMTRLDDLALRLAAEADERRADGKSLGPLDGLPIVVKDLEPMRGVRYTRGARILKDDVASVDALYVERLRAAGAVFLGKTNLPEFAFHGVTDNLIVGPTSTPWNTAFNSGGSSGGSAAAVASGLAAVAEASDGGGSIRIPAALCGLVGYKPSAGLVADPAPNAFGLVNPYIHVGSVGRTVGDVRAFVNVIRGWDRFDPFSALDPALDDSAVHSIGVDLHFGDFPVEPRVLHAIESALTVLSRDPRWTFRSISLEVPSHGDMTRTWVRQVAVAHAATMDGFSEAGMPIEHDMPAEFQEVIGIGRAASALEFYRDGELRTRVLTGIESALDEVDVIITPTLAVDGVPNGVAWGTTASPSSVDGETVDPSIGWCLTHPLNLSGHPAVTIPAGLSDRGLPVGLQIIGPRWADERVLAVADAMTSVLGPLHAPS